MKGGKSGKERASEEAISSNVKSKQKYERFGETIRYLTVEELQKLFDSIDQYRDKLLFEMIYELGCRVGEFVRIKLKDLDFGRSTVFFPAENTKTGHRRTSFLPRGLTNEVKSLLKSKGRMSKREEKIKCSEEHLFLSPYRKGAHYSENRIRQLFQKYVRKAGLDRDYGTDSKGRRLHQFTVHGLRLSHISHYVHVHKLPLPIVQKQVGHRTLRATSVYLNPSPEAIAEAYDNAQARSLTKQGLRSDDREYQSAQHNKAYKS